MFVRVSVLCMQLQSYCVFYCVLLTVLVAFGSFCFIKFILLETDMRRSPGRNLVILACKGILLTVGVDSTLGWISIVGC